MNLSEIFHESFMNLSKNDSSETNSISEPYDNQKASQDPRARLILKLIICEHEVMAYCSNMEKFLMVKRKIIHTLRVPNTHNLKFRNNGQHFAKGKTILPNEACRIQKDVKSLKQSYFLNFRINTDNRLISETVIHSKRRLGERIR